MTFDPLTTTRKFTTSPKWLRETKSMLRAFHEGYSIEKLRPVLHGIEKEESTKSTDLADRIALNLAYKSLKESASK